MKPKSKQARPLLFVLHLSKCYEFSTSICFALWHFVARGWGYGFRVWGFGLGFSLPVKLHIANAFRNFQWWPSRSALRAHRMPAVIQLTTTKLAELTAPSSELMLLKLKRVQGVRGSGRGAVKTTQVLRIVVSKD